MNPVHILSFPAVPYPAFQPLNNPFLPGRQSADKKPTYVTLDGSGGFLQDTRNAEPASAINGLIEENTYMNTAFRYLAVLPGLLYILSGIRWAVDPGGAAETLGMSLMDGVGLSSQIGIVGAFFLAGGIMIFLGIIRQRAIWFLAPAMIMGFTATYRVIAWGMHDAAFTVPMFVIELINTTILLLAARAATDE